MTPSELRSAFKAAGLPLYRAAKLLGVDPRTVRRWVQDAGTPGYRPVPPMVVMILTLMDRMCLTADQIEAMVAASRTGRIRETSRQRAP